MNSQCVLKLAYYYKIKLTKGKKSTNCNKTRVKRTSERDYIAAIEVEGAI